MTGAPSVSPYRQHASGLYVPEAQSRLRTVAGRDEWKTVQRATRLLESYGLNVFLGCPQCKDAPIEKLTRHDGGVTFRCSHRDLEWATR